MNEKAHAIARLARATIPGGRILRIQISDRNNPHYARILLQNYQNKRIALFAGLGDDPVENTLTNALLWFHELENFKTRRAEKLWIVSRRAPKLARLQTTLRANWRSKIRIFDPLLVEAFDEVAEIKTVRFGKRHKIAPKAQKMIPLLPDEVQAQGKKLAFKGLPFLRFSGNNVLFGVEQQTRILDSSTSGELGELLECLRLYRQHDSPNKKHAFYKLWPEAWLESTLRNDITILDRNLVLSPVHQQFRASSEKIDLLALRRDGRLVIIELKVSPNREHLFQAVDYWHEIEKQRVAGNLAGLFGRLPIADAPSLIYLVAPHSCYHPDFGFLAGTVLPEPEVYRFDLNEDWRKKIRILEKQKIQAS
jgi:hypothetical protein